MIRGHMCMPVQAAATTIHCCATPNLSRSGNGRFYMNCRVASTPAVMDNPTLGGQLWKKTEELIETAKIDSHQVQTREPLNG